MLASSVEASIVDCRLNSIARWLTVVVVVVGGLRGHGVHGVRVVKARSQKCDSRYSRGEFCFLIAIYIA